MDTSQLERNPRRLKYWATIENGKDYSEVYNPLGKYPVFGSGGVFAQSDEFLYDRPSVLLGRKGTIDKPILVDVPFWVVDTMYYTKIKPDVCPKYFYYCCTQIPFSLFQYGSALPSMTKTDLENVYLPFEKLTIQEEIAAYLDKQRIILEKGVERIDEEIERLSQLKCSIIYETVTDCKSLSKTGNWFDAVPEEWPYAKVGHLFTSQLGKMLDSKKMDGDLYPYLKNVNIAWGSIVLDNLSEMGFDETDREKYKLMPGDLLVCEGGEIGKCAIVPDDFPEGIYYQKALHRVRSRTNNHDDVHYLKHILFLMSKMNYYPSSSDKATIAHLPAEELSKMRIPFPPKNLISTVVSKLNSKIECIDRMISIKEKERNRLIELMNAIINKYCSGDM